jgi:hypothetical protein
MQNMQKILKNTRNFILINFMHYKSDIFHSVPRKQGSNKARMCAELELIDRTNAKTFSPTQYISPKKTSFSTQKKPTQTASKINPHKHTLKNPYNCHTNYSLQTKTPLSLENVNSRNFVLSKFPRDFRA